jgi:hypothetical protein
MDIGKKEGVIMDHQTWGIVIFGSLLVAFAVFASFMADRQKDRERKASGQHPAQMKPTKAKPEI